MQQSPNPNNRGHGQHQTQATSSSNTIAENRKARYDYFIEERIEAGLALEGWEVKSLRAGRANLTESYALLKNGEALLIGAHFAPLASASTHVHADPVAPANCCCTARNSTG